MKKVISKNRVPDHLRRSSVGYYCINCDAHKMNSIVALQHNCKKYRAKMSNVAKNLKSPINGNCRQARFIK